ncbi:hypothetical protein LXA43DRAFT_1099413 [Ganoderma leucocontextum]|nr:hypothetical protein LXA43DRAFT_1099413 [Ganoderma leucocontextum]
MDPRRSSPELSEDSQTGAESPTSRTEFNVFRQWIEDEDFWYEDGDVVLLLGSTAFKLHASRLAGYCGYFHELFSPGRLMGTALAGEAKGRRVYHVTPELSVANFKHLLKVLESPFEYATKPLSQTLAISLLFAADTLSCGYVLDLAKRRLCEIWDGRSLPATDRSDSRDRTYPSAIRAIKLARQYSIPGILRRAFYELLSSWAFWDALEPPTSQSVLDDLRISEEDIRMLLVARVKLGELWRDFVVHVPEGTWNVSHRSPYDTRRCCHANKEKRAGRWLTFVFERGGLEVFDPIRYDFIKQWGKALEYKEWCQACLDRKRKAWEEKRAEWWEGMDELFGL